MLSAMLLRDDARMAVLPTDVTIEALQAVAGQLRTALQVPTRDFLLCRQYACELKTIMIVLGSSVSASGTNFQLALESASSLIGDVEKMQIYAAMKNTRGRLIRTGLSNGGRRAGGAGGVLHD